MATRTCRTFTIAINIESIMVPGLLPLLDSQPKSRALVINENGI